MKTKRTGWPGSCALALTELVGLAVAGLPMAFGQSGMTGEPTPVEIATPEESPPPPPPTPPSEATPPAVPTPPCDPAQGSSLAIMASPSSMGINCICRLDAAVVSGAPDYYVSWPGLGITGETAPFIATALGEQTIEAILYARCPGGAWTPVRQANCMVHVYPDYEFVDEPVMGPFGIGDTGYSIINNCCDIEKGGRPCPAQLQYTSRIVHENTIDLSVGGGVRNQLVSVIEGKIGAHNGESVSTEQTTGLDLTANPGYRRYVYLRFLLSESSGTIRVWNMCNPEVCTYHCKVWRTELEWHEDKCSEE